MSQAVSLDSNTRLVSIVYFVYSTSTWKTTRLRLATSVRLTVTVYSPSRELTVDRFSNEIGWKLVEKSFVEFAHDRRKKIPFSFRWWRHFLRSLVRVSWVRLGTVAKREDIRASRVNSPGYSPQSTNTLPGYSRKGTGYVA